MTKEGKDWVKYVALGLSIISLLFHAVNFYNTWYVPPRAELSIIFTNCWSQIDYESRYFRSHVEGVITNEGERATRLQEKVVYTIVAREDKADVRLVSTRSIYIPYDVEKEILNPKEQTSFNITDSIRFSDFENHNLDPKNVTGITLEIIHDDGIGTLGDSKRIELN